MSQVKEVCEHIETLSHSIQNLNPGALDYEKHILARFENLQAIIIDRFNNLQRTFETRFQSLEHLQQSYCESVARNVDDLKSTFKADFSRCCRQNETNAITSSGYVGAFNSDSIPMHHTLNSEMPGLPKNFSIENDIDLKSNTKSEESPRELTATDNIRKLIHGKECLVPLELRRHSLAARIDKHTIHLPRDIKNRGSGSKDTWVRIVQWIFGIRPPDGPRGIVGSRMIDPASPFNIGAPYGCLFPLVGNTRCTSSASIINSLKAFSEPLFACVLLHKHITSPPSLI